MRGKPARLHGRFYHRRVRIAVAADERAGVAEEVSAELRRFAAEPSADDDDRGTWPTWSRSTPGDPPAARARRDDRRRPGRDARPGPAGARDDRPYLITNFALTLDGHATIAGRSGSIGATTDTAMLVGLRTRVDAVMIGAGTMRAERYGRVVGDPAKRERRERDGLAARPAGGDRLRTARPALGRAAVHRGLRPRADRTASDDAGRRRPRPRSTCCASRTASTWRRCSSYLRRERGVRVAALRGRPASARPADRGRLVDELFVTHAPKLAGGDGPGLVSGLAEASARSSSPGCWPTSDRRAVRPLPPAPERTMRLIDYTDADLDFSIASRPIRR